jgi:hypothetical protein
MAELQIKVHRHKRGIYTDYTFCVDGDYCIGGISGNQIYLFKDIRKPLEEDKIYFEAVRSGVGYGLRGFKEVKQ